MTMRYFLITLIAMGLSFSVIAQDTEGEKRLDPTPPPSPVEIEKDNVQKALPNAQDLPASLDEEKSKQITNYFNEALENYGTILEEREEAEVTTTHKRIDANRELLDTQKQNLSASETKMRQLKGEYLRRYLALKNSFEQGKLDKNTYNQQLDKLAREYAFQMESLKNDLSFYKEQSTKTDTKLKQLEELNRINKIIMSQNPKKAKAENTEPKRVPTQLELLLPRIEAAGCFKHKNIGQAPDIK